ncbi:MAG TPA: hypothetical protein VFM55_10005 [Micromonosporaceae bacterium]|nr:hypothetical protein [Micromonosporaceae bacterium]
MIRRLTFAAAALSSVAPFIVMIMLRKDTILVQALTGAGTLTTAVFTALAALSAQRAAAESSSTATRAREALARTIKPTMFADVMRGNGVDIDKAIGSYGPGRDRGAIDVKVTWHLRDGRKVVDRADALIPEPTGRNPHLPRNILIGPWMGSAAATVERVTVEYTDESRLMRWRFTRRFMTDDEWRAEGYEPRTDLRRELTLDSDMPVG